MRSIEKYWRNTLGLEIDATQGCPFRALMHAVFRYVREPINHHLMTYYLATYLKGRKLNATFDP